MASRHTDHPRIHFEDLPLSFRLFVYSQVLPIAALLLYVSLVPAPASSTSLLTIFLPFFATPVLALEGLLFWRGFKDLKTKLASC
ncbi:hypothetical protein A3843_10630 [Pseudovibrio exalbescens]|uniref:Uncharacterized protein n=1 Tax=Pseudovibrio exalbescens TaxID=197461 RepID=A0A1U7JH22_9HYPH|nr:hypothetical protein A3843_10630 [Pseudovibrio exalbescens]